MQAFGTCSHPRPPPHQGLPHLKGVWQNQTLGAGLGSPEPVQSSQPSCPVVPFFLFVWERVPFKLNQPKKSDAVSLFSPGNPTGHLSQGPKRFTWFLQWTLFSRQVRRRPVFVPNFSLEKRKAKTPGVFSFYLWVLWAEETVQRRFSEIAARSTWDIWCSPAGRPSAGGRPW